MSYGFNIFDSGNKLIYDSNSITWNQVDMFLVPASNSISRDYPFLAGRTLRATQMFINAPPVTSKAIAHTISISGTTVSISGGNQDAYFLVVMQ